MRGRGLKRRRPCWACWTGSMSPPMRGRGLKLSPVSTLRSTDVAPHAGAWIETWQGTPMSGNPSVAPHAGAWIETNNTEHIAINPIVAPHAGAWIETNAAMKLSQPLSVAPHAGAWIETRPALGYHSRMAVAPHAGAWIETVGCPLVTSTFCRPPCGGVD